MENGDRHLVGVLAGVAMGMSLVSMISYTARYKRHRSDIGRATVEYVSPTHSDSARIYFRDGSSVVVPMTPGTTYKK